MNLVVADSNGVDYMQTDDFTLNLQYGDVNDFELTMMAASLISDARSLR